MSDLAEQQPDLSACDREPIHIPGAIQPHGVLLALGEDLKVRRAAGNVQALLGYDGDPLGQQLGDIIPMRDIDLSSVAEECGFVASVRTPAAEVDLFAHYRAGELIVEFETAPEKHRSGAHVLRDLLPIVKEIGAAKDVSQAANAAAAGVRRITDYDRVMIYHFLEDHSGQVIAEARSDEVDPFLNHRYPASDIPQQARELYLRNPLRVIHDVSYTPAPLRGGDGPLDLSGAVLRSVSPVHIQYLKNMGVGASASFSLVRADALWGLIACHNRTAKPIAHEEREMCRRVALALDQAIAGLEEENSQREALKLTRRREELLPLIAGSDSVAAALQTHADELRRLIAADGIALLLDTAVLCSGVTPTQAAVRELGRWLIDQPRDLLVTNVLSELYAPASDWSAYASGLISSIVARNPLTAILWFRAEEIETVNWAGNPHKPAEATETPGQLTPRRSFELWAETVRGRSRPWRSNEQDAVRRMTSSVAEVVRQKAISELNRQLTSEVAEKDLLMREMHHRVQNSLQLVTSLLQHHNEEGAEEQLALARDRVLSVALLHRRLWRSEDLQNINLETFFSELVEGLMRTWSRDWQDKVTLDVEPIRMSAHDALLIALIVSELLTNAVKHAYAGAAGPLNLTAREAGTNQVEITVSDRGVGTARSERPGGFGSRMIQRLVSSLHGEFGMMPNEPGTRVTLTVPVTGRPGTG
jgi:light-regulated signal transduction histidine kinase (bacteriophytochrome)